MPNPLVFFQIAVGDIPEARRFYEHVFDWTVSEDGSIDPRGPADFDIRGGFIQAKPGAPTSITPWFRVEDLWAAFERAQEAGGEVLVPIRQDHIGRHVCIVRAPDGLVMGIVQA